MDPEYMRRNMEHIERALDNGVYDGIREAINRGDYQRIREDIDRGVYEGLLKALHSPIQGAIDSGVYHRLQGVAQELERAKQSASTDPLKSVLKDLGPTGIAKLPFGNTNLADVVLGNMNVTEANLANASATNLAVRDLSSVAEEAQRHWLSDASGQELLRNASLRLSEDYHEPIRRAVELASNPKVREMVSLGIQEPQTQALVEQLLSHHERQESLTGASPEEAARQEQVIAAQTLSRVMFFLLFFQVALSGVHAVAGAEAYVDALRDLVSSLIALCGHIVSRHPRDKD